MSDAIQQFDIVIVGAGLVGATLASLLSKNTTAKPLSIAVIDAHNKAKPVVAINNQSDSEPIFDFRVVALNQASQQLLAQVGVWPIIQSQRVCAYRDMIVWDGEGTGQIHFRAEDVQCNQLGYIVENTLVLRAILDSLQDSQQIDFIWGVSLEQIARCNQSVQLTLTDGRTLSAPLIIAADGANSKVRELMGFHTREWSYHQQAIVATVQCEQSHQLTAWQNFLPTGPLAFLPLDHPSEKYCSIVWSLDNKLADDMMSLTDQAFGDRLGKAFEYRLGRIENVDKRLCFPLKQCHAVDYITDNIALAGDAAHAIHPLAGQGVNLGLLDAKVLAAEVSRALERCLPLSDISLLQRYQRQRKLHNLEAMAVMEGLKRLFGSREPAIHWLRNTGLRQVNILKPLKNWLAKQAIGIEDSDSK